MCRWLTRLVQRRPQRAAQRFERALAEHQAGRLESAQAAYRDALAADPDHVDALHFIGVVASQRGEYSQAVDWISRSLARRERNPYAYLNLGKAYRALGQSARAVACYRRAIEIEPRNFEALLLLGRALGEIGETAQALVHLRETRSCMPADPRAYHALANAFDEIGERRLAITCFREAIALQPDLTAAHCDLGTTLKALNRIEEAETAYREAIRLDPGNAVARLNLGIVLRDRHAAAEAIGSFLAAIEHKPDFAEAHYCLGHAYCDGDRLEEARACFRKALSIRPDYAEARWSLAMSCLPSVCSVSDDPEKARQAFSTELNALLTWFEGKPATLGERAVGVQQPFALAYQDRDNSELLRRYGALCARLMQRWREDQRIEAAPTVSRSGPIRIGVVSQYFRSHSVWHAIVRGWFAQMDRERFALHAFCLGTGGDQETEFARSRAASFHQGPKSTLEWVEVIARHTPDVLIYPEIGMDPMACKLASLRLAPVQVATWGHPETTGLPTIDYYLSAEGLEGPGYQDHYTEQVVLLPGLGCCLEKESTTPTPPDLDRWAIDPEAPMLISAGTPFKYASQYDGVFIAIARRLPDCRFVFFRHWVPGLTERLEQRLNAAFAHAGLDYGQHVVFVPWQSRAAFHGWMQQAHVYLDTIGFSGFNTAIQALECELPIVAMAGRFLRGRLASGLLQRIGLGELVATSADDYVDLAVRLALDGNRRAAASDRIASRHAAIYGDASPIRALEQFLAEMTTGRTH